MGQFLQQEEENERKSGGSWWLVTASRLIFRTQQTKRFFFPLGRWFLLSRGRSLRLSRIKSWSGRLPSLAGRPTFRPTQGGRRPWRPSWSKCTARSRRPWSWCTGGSRRSSASSFCNRRRNFNVETAMVSGSRLTRHERDFRLHHFRRNCITTECFCRRFCKISGTKKCPISLKLSLFRQKFRRK